MAERTEQCMAELWQLARSAKADERRSSLNAIRDRLESGLETEYFAIARELVEDDDNDCRWQAIIVIAEFIDSSPEAVWQVVLDHSHNADEDMRDALATVLLEHLLEKHFDEFIRKLEVEVTNGNEAVADILGRCWPFGEAEERWNEVEKLLETYKNRINPN